MEARHVHNRLVQRRPLMPVCLLLLLGEDAGHGYELAERLKKWGFELSGPGPVYRELRILEENGLVRSMWSAPQSGPVPRVYELTAIGRAALDDAAGELSGLGLLIEEFQARHRRLGAGPPPPPPPPPPPASPPPAAPIAPGRQRRGRRSARG